MALGAFTLDEAVGQKHVLFRVKELVDGFGVNQGAAGVVAQVPVDLPGQFVVFRGVRAVPVVKTDVKPIQIRLAARRDVGHELLRRDAGFLGGNHDGRAVCVVGADKIHRVALHALKPHPDVGLDVFHDVTDMKVAVGVGQGGGDKECAGHL